MILELLGNLLVRLPLDDPALIVTTPDTLTNVPNHVFEGLNTVAIGDLDADSLGVDKEEVDLYLFSLFGVLTAFPSWINVELPPLLKLPFIFW